MNGILQPGQRLCGAGGGVFCVEAWVGEGSYSRVYRGREAEGLVALKVAKPEVPGARERLQREVKLHTLFAHPAIPALRDAGSPSDGMGEAAAWLARCWAEGSTLRHRLERDRSLPLIQAVPLLLRIAGAVSALHSAGWSHGDLRPENIVIEAGSHRPFLLDLGEAEPFEKAAAPDAGCRGGGGPEIEPAIGRNGRSPGRRLAPGAWPRRAKPSPVGTRPPAAARDLRQLGALLAWALTGVDPDREPDRLARAGGYHPVVVELWQECRQGSLPSAAAFEERLERLARQLRLRI